MKINNIQIDIYNFLILIFPIILILRSATINLYLLICSLFVIYNFFKKKIEIKSDIFLILFFYIYLVSISFQSNDILVALKSSISQLRFFLFAIFIKIYFDNSNLKNFIKFFTAILLFVSFDTLFQYFTGHDIFGLEPGQPNRLSGPFGDELIVGHYISALSIPIFSYFVFNFDTYSFKNKILINAILLIFSISILLSGERMSLIVYVFCIIILFFIKSKLKNFIFFLITLFFALFFAFKTIPSVDKRFKSFSHDLIRLHNSNHGKIFMGAINVWHNHKIFGTGLKNYRIECPKINDKNNYLCSTHPHNLYIEILTETGVIGMFFAIFLIINLLIKSLSLIYKEKIKKNISFYLGSFVYVFVFLIPFKSHGSIFSTFNSAIFWFHVGIVLYLFTKQSSLSIQKKRLN